MTKTATDTDWKTAITDIEPNHVRVRGYDIGELMGRVSFGAAVYLILRGELPDEKTGRLMDAILVSSIDHGATPPSTLAARTVASTGGAMSQSVAAGILSINRLHGGAIEDCARQLATINGRVAVTGEALETAVEAVLSEMKCTRTIPGREGCSSWRPTPGWPGRTWPRRGPCNSPLRPQARRCPSTWTGRSPRCWPIWGSSGP
jgi:citrate synthase